MRRMLAALAAKRADRGVPAGPALGRPVHRRPCWPGWWPDLASPVLLLVNYRPGYTPPPGMQVLNLQELSPRQTGELLASLLQGEPPAPLAASSLSAPTATRSMSRRWSTRWSRPACWRARRSGWVLTRPLAEAARASHHPRRYRRAHRPSGRSAPSAAAPGAVVGREFVVSIIALVGEDIGDIAPGLAQLQAADLIRQRRLEPELEYMFKHALTQDVAYEGLLKTERQRLHARTAQAMEAVFAERIPEFVETLATTTSAAACPTRRSTT